MATLGTGALTLVDAAKRMDPDGKAAAIAELLSQSNMILDDIPFVEGNLPSGHRMSVRTGLPTVSWYVANQGVAASKSTVAQIDEACGILDCWNEVDKEIADLNGNTAEFRMGEATSSIEAMSQTFAEALIYGNTGVTPESITGFAPRYNSLSGDVGQNVISAGGSGSDNTSVYLVCWSPQTVFGIYPKGKKAGLEHKDYGEVVAETTAAMAGQRMRVYRDNYRWHVGLGVKDWRNVVRIPNIDVSDLAALTGTQASTAATELLRLMSRAIDRIPNPSAGRLTFIANRTVASLLRVQALNKSSGALSIEDAMNQFGRRITETRFQQIPVRLVDRLLNSEAAVS